MREVKFQQQLSKHCYRGQGIVMPIELVQAAQNKECVYHSNMGMKPAAIFMSMHFSLVMKDIENHRFFHVLNIDDRPKCESCGKRISGKKFQVVDEQFTPQQGLFECAKCHIVS